MGNRRFVLMATSDDEDEAPPPLRVEEEQQQPTSQGKRKKMKLSDEEEWEEEEEEKGRAKWRNRTRVEEPSGNGGGEDEEAQEDAKPVGEVRKVSGKRMTRLTHYGAFEYDGVRYELEDSVLLFPKAPNQKPYVAIIKDITQNVEGNMMVTGQWFYRPEEAQKGGGGNWQSRDTRELFYSFHRDDVPAESVMHKCVVHFIPLNKQIPNRQQHPGFIVQKVYDTERRRLFKLTDKDYEDTKQGELDELVQKTLARLGDLPDIETEDNHIDQEDQLKNGRLLRRKNMSPLDVSRDDEGLTKSGQPLKAETPGSVTSNISEYYTILSNFKALTGETQRDKWLERLLQVIQFICSPMDSGQSDAKEDLHNCSSKGADGAQEKSGDNTFVWPDSAVPAVTALEKSSHDALSTDFQKYNRKMRQLVFNLKNNALLARCLLNGELEPSKIMNMSPTELKMTDQHTRQFTYVHAHRVIPPGTRVSTYCGIKHLGAIREALIRYGVLDRFVQGPLGHFLEIPHSLHLAAPQLIYQVLVREVTFPGARHDEMWFEIGGMLYRYGKQEFILISGLRFGPIDKESLEVRLVEPDSLRARLFPLQQQVVSGDDIKLLLSTRHDLVSEDVLKLVYIAVVNMILLGQDERAHVEDFVWTMVENLHAFEAFPWGTYVYSRSLHYLRLATSEGKLTGKVGKKVNLYGFVWAFQWWLIETFPWIENKWAIRLSDPVIIPRCRKWLSKKRPKIKNYDECLMNVRGSSTTLEPTDAERDTDCWRSFNPQHSVGVDVHKFGGGGGDKEEESGGKEGGDKEEVSRIHEDEEENEDEEEAEEEAVHRERISKFGQEAGLPHSPHLGQDETGIIEMLTLTLELLQRMDGKISQISTRFDREMDQMKTRLRQLERGQTALFTHLRVPPIDDSPDHSDDQH